MEAYSNEATAYREKKYYYRLEQIERRLRNKLRLAGKAGDKERADDLWIKTQSIARQRKDSAYYKLVILTK